MDFGHLKHLLMLDRLVGHDMVNLEICPVDSRLISSSLSLSGEPGSHPLTTDCHYSTSELIT